MEWWVTKEALRLHPPTPLMLPHRANADVKLTGYDVPKGSNVLVNVWAIARNPAVWKDPLEFRPERFADEDVDMKGHNFRLLPFGAGRRVCPGAQLGINMVQSMLGHLLHQFRCERRSRVDLFIAYPSINPLCEEIGTTRRRLQSSSPLAGRRRRRRGPISIRYTRRPLQRDHITPWAQSTQSTGGSTWSTGDPFIANESPAASASTREIRGRRGNEPSTALFWRSRWDDFCHCGLTAARSTGSDLVVYPVLSHWGVTLLAFF
ncbi:hypothetical protein Taro_020793 [Colocasia esculenta]|uniref:Uncharacterized protein n=1 Tax=Colocasia esculenta TaxID=4460 RepID=A0A843UZP0_COLES|nr:hypothetical protein [Colocasia esculenta]